MVEEICKNLRPILGKKIDSLWFAYLMEDYKGKKEIEDILQILYAKTLNKNLADERMLLVPPSKDIAFGNYILGQVIYNGKELYPFGIREEEFIQHMGIFGRSGSGKTNSVFVIILNLLKNKKPFLVFDWKRNFREILDYTKREDILVFTVGRSISPIQFNPLIPPPGVEAKTWLKKLIEIIAHSFFVGEGVMYLLLKAIDSVYKKFGVYDGEIDKWPTMEDILRWLECYPAKGRESNWMVSTLRAVKTLCFGEMGKVLNIREQISLDELLKKNVIMELDALTNTDKTFFIETLLLWIHHYRMGQQEKETWKHTLIIEEAHHILLREKQELRGGEAITDLILREIRELGEAIILIDQHPHMISVPALGNTYTTVTQNLKYQSDINTAANCMLLDNEQRKHLGKLPVGHAIVKIQDRWTNPFLIKIPLVNVKKGIVTDKDIRRLMRGYSGYSAGIEPGNIKQEVIRPILPADRKIKESEKKILIDIHNYPFSNVVERYKRLGISAYQGNKNKEFLIRKGLIESKKIIKENGRIKLLNITDDGKAILGKLGYSPNLEKNGLEHRFWKDEVANYYRHQGYKVSVEKKVNGTPDLIVEKQDKVIAIEIETGKSNAIWNIKKCLRHNFNLVISVATNKKAEEKIRTEIIYNSLDKNPRVKLINTKGFDIDMYECFGEV